MSAETKQERQARKLADQRELWEINYEQRQAWKIEDRIERAEEQGKPRELINKLETRYESKMTKYRKLLEARKARQAKEKEDRDLAKRFSEFLLGQREGSLRKEKYP